MERPMQYDYMWVSSPIGNLRLVSNGSALSGILWETERPNRVSFEPMVENINCPILNMTADQLSEYFSGRRSVFDVPLHFKGTDFQKQVWDALLTIPFGETRTYSEVAQQIGRPAAVRAVGAANGRNPIAIIAPCHRVIGMDGALTGFAGGLKAKELLLTIEGRTSSKGLIPINGAHPTQGQTHFSEK
jgi:methylated-DNA-[protein]-cysteine S-methyltransferase